MPWKKGQSGNSLGPKPKKVSRIDWALIDSYIADSTKWAYKVVDGLEKDLADLTNKERLDMRLKAYSIIVKLAPNRITGQDGGAIVTKAIDNEQMERFLKRHVKSD